MLSTWEELEAESERLREEEIRLAKFILADDAYEDLSAEVRAGLGRRFVLLQEMVKVVYEQKSDVDERHRRAKRDREAEAESKDSGRAPDVFTQVRALLSAGAVHRSGMRIDQADLEKIRQHLSFEVVELNNLFQNKDAIDIGKVAEEACDILGVLVHMFVYLGMSEQDVANQCAEKFAKRFTIPK